MASTSGCADQAQPGAPHEQPGAPHAQPGAPHEQPVAAQAQPGAAHTPRQPGTNPSHVSQVITQPKFPSTSTCQMPNANVNIANAEAEFNKIALDACRSTISQMEMELKKANEALDIRNKRITNLESQVGHASDLFAARTTPGDLSESNARGIVEKLQEISQKIERLQSTSSSNNIVINPCHSTQSIPNQQSNFVH